MPKPVKSWKERTYDFCENQRSLRMPNLVDIRLELQVVCHLKDPAKFWKMYLSARIPNTLSLGIR